jgi:serpin B
MGAELCEADFAGSPAAAGRAINEWAKTKTRGRIAVLTDPANIDRLTRLVLATAVFFEGTWALPFPKAETRPAPFRPSLSSGTIQVPTMHLEEEFNYARLEGFQVVELPYLGGEMSMAIFLPDAPDGWTDLENRLSSPALSRWFGDLRKERIKVALPKFQSGSSFRLDDALGRAGLRDAFDPGLADFGGMTSQKPLNLGSVAHAAKVEVDEAGTRAAGVSWATVVLGLIPKFQADHPFLFVIRDVPTGAILFMGRVLKPEWRDGARRSDGSKTDHDPDRGSRPRYFDSLLRILGLK